MQRYNPKDIEPKWQSQWAKDKIYEASEDPSKPKKYILEYFPYPSGAAMHVGHVRNYTIGDVLARFNRMQGYNVLHPMGWDAFGLPAENYAIKTGISPRQAIDENTTKFKAQLDQMGFSYDWSREIDSTDPKYYRWTQWFFLMLFKKGLAYQQESLQWWCPFDKTVLANEQVEAGRCWRCGNIVEKKALKQWFFKITDYADRLAKDLDDVNWSDSIKAMQRNWIGRSAGAEIDFQVVGNDVKVKVFTTRPDTIFGATFLVLAPEHPLVEKITVPEKREHVGNYIKAAQAKSDVERQETSREKTGVFTGAFAVNPLNDERIPIWVADYVLTGYGTGAIMAVPAHDERDLAFAEKFELAVKPVIAPVFIDEYTEPDLAKATDRPVALAIAHNPETDKYCLQKWNHQPLNRYGLEWPGGGLVGDETIEQGALREFTEETGYTDVSVDKVVPAAVTFYYISRAGESRRAVKSIVHLTVNSMANNGISGSDDYEKDAYEVIWLTKDEIMARLDTMEDQFKGVTNFIFDQPCYTDHEGVLINSGKYDNLPTDEARDKIVADLVKQGDGTEKINYKMRDWLISRQRYWGAPIPIVHCPKDGEVAVPEDQLPVLLPKIDKYEPSGDGRSPLANVPEFVQTTCPKCGGPAERETDTMDGFACSSWYFLRFADPHNDKRPFDDDKAKFWLPVDDYIGGAEHAVMHLLYARFWTKVMFDEGLINFQEPFTTLRNHGMILAPDGSKMSKSKGNTIEPGTLIDQGYGADAIRIMELFIGPWNQSAAWSVEGMGGAYRFLQRVWLLVQEHMAAESTSGQADNSVVDLQKPINRAVKKVSEDLLDMGFNTAIANLMETVNEFYKIKTGLPISQPVWHEPLIKLVQLLAPFAPHITEELWQQLGQPGSVHTSQWPAYDEQYLVDDIITIVIQVNGKVRAQLQSGKGQSEEQILAAAQADANVQNFIAGKDVKKTIYIADRLLNIVV